jgi:GH43 family beta-xylosidase
MAATFQRWLALGTLLGGCTDGSDARGPDTETSDAGSDATGGPGAQTSDPDAGSGPGPGPDATGDTTDPDGDSSGEPPLDPVPGVWVEVFERYSDRVAAGVQPNIDANWGMDAPDPAASVDRFSVRYSGRLTAPASETWTIITETDDGVRLWIDGALVIDDWNPHYVTRNEATVQLTAGAEVPIVLEYFEIDLDASVRLSWSSPSTPEQPVPADALSTLPVSPELPGPKPPYRNAVLPFNCPDPGAIHVPDAADPGYYMVCTGGPFSILYSPDLIFWNDTGSTILGGPKPPWAANGNRNWAPEIHRIGDRFLAYFTSVNGSNVLSVGVAWADEVTGPYTFTDGPLVQHPQGVIDASFYVVGGVPYLTYKIDGNSVGQATPIFVRELAADGLSFSPGSTQTQILTNNPGTWEGGVVEAQWITEHDGMLYMFYSGNVYDHRYRTGVARASSITGPWEKHGAPILGNSSQWVGPGHGTVLDVGDLDYFLYHAWYNAGDGTNAGGPGRVVMLDRIDWVDGWPQIHGGIPSDEWLPWPGEG